MVIDVIFSILVIISFIRGFKKGLIHAIFTLVAIVVGIIAGVYLSEIAAVYIDKWFNVSSRYLPIVAFIAVFFGVYLLFRLLSKSMEGLFKLMHLNILNKLLGGLVWVVIWIMVFSTVLFYANNMKLLSDEIKTESIVYERTEAFAPEVISFIGRAIPPVRNIYRSLQQWFDNLEEKTRESNISSPA